MAPLQWIFDPLPPSGAMQGGNASLHVFKPDLETFVREVLQNSRDQGIGGPIKVQFTFEQVSGTAKVAFLQAIGWSQLRPHIQGAAAAGFAQVSRTIADGLRSVDDEPLTLLRIDDCGTRGLIGDEDNPHENFNALCRNTLVSLDNPQRGGSYGLGKAVLWRFSSILTVLFSSRVDGPPRPGFRLFGRSELPFHVAGGQRYGGPGWYGLPQTVTGNLRRAISAWDSDVASLAGQAQLNRDSAAGTGTSILVVGFREPQIEEVRSARDIAHDVARIAARWFWPTIQRGELQVHVTARESGRTVLAEDVCLTTELDPFALAISATDLKAPPLQPGAVTEVLIPLKVPGRRANGDPGSAPVDAQIRLRVRHAIDNGGRPELHNRVALTRGAGMVVQYRPVRSAASERSFHAVLLAGLASGNTNADAAAEAFLRAAEPPAHDEWTVTPRVRAEYKQGFSRALQDLWQVIDQQLARLFEERGADDTPGPALLAKMFHVSSPDGPPAGVPAPKFKIRDLDARLNGEVWQFSGRVTRSAGETRPWIVRVGLRLAGETGQGEPVAIAELAADLGDVRDQGAERIMELPAEAAEVSFVGTSTLVGDIADSHIAARTRLNLDVRPGFRGDL